MKSIIELVREAGFNVEENGAINDGVENAADFSCELTRFAALVRAEDTALLQQVLEALELSRIYIQKAIMRAKERGYATDTIRDLNDDLTHHDDTIAALKERLK